MRPLFLVPLLLLTAAAGSSAFALDLPATAVFEKGPNRYDGEVLEITKGRGATLGWYVLAQREERVRVSIEYRCEAPLNQAYQLSFDGSDRFWDVVPTEGEGWARAELGVFPMRAGTPVLVLLVPPSGTAYPHPVRFRRLVLEGAIDGNLAQLPPPEELATPDAAPGFGQRLGGLHPGLELADLRDESLTLRISGLARRGRELLLTTWDGDLYSLDLDALPETGPPLYRRLARGLSEPMGLAVHEGRVFVTEKNEATELVDGDGDGLFETYRCLSHDWPCTMDYHEYLFGAVVKDGYLHFAASVGMAARGKDNYQAPLRGSVFRVHLDSGVTELVAGGLRTPDGLGLGPGGALLATDNQGEWLPANKLVHVTEGAFFNFRAIPPWHPYDRPGATPPAVWLPQGEIAASPTQPILLPNGWGPYAGQVVFGDNAYGGLQRAFLEEVEGALQGAVFRFSQGFRHLYHRFVLDEDGSLYAGGIARGKDEEFIARVSGLSRIRYTGAPVLEPLAARLFANGIEIEFTRPLGEGQGWNPAAYHVAQWVYQPTQTYGGQKVRHRRAEVRSATLSPDRRRVFLELPALVAGEVVHVRLSEHLRGEEGERLWSGEFWYTANQIPADRIGAITPAPTGAIEAGEEFFRYSKGDAGRILFQSYCAACHSLDGTRLAGPGLRGLIGGKRLVRNPATGDTREIVADADYLRQSILEPNALLAEGYPENLMPPIGAILGSAQIDALVDYLVRATAE